MKRIIVFSLLVVLAVLVASGGAAAQETNRTSNQTAQADVVATFDNGAVITDYEFRDGRVYVAIDAERRTSVTVADSLAGIDTEGATTIPQETKAVRPGGDSLTFPVTEYNGGHSVSVSIDGQSVRLSSRMDAQGGDDNPLEYFGGTSGVFAGIGLSMFSSLAAAGVIIWRDNKGVVRGSP